MTQSNDTTVAKTRQSDVLPVNSSKPQQAASASTSTKDAGRVHFGAGMMRF